PSQGQVPDVHQRDGAGPLGCEELPRQRAPALQREGVQDPREHGPQGAGRPLLLQPSREAVVDDAEGAVGQRAGVHRRVQRGVQLVGVTTREGEMTEGDADDGSHPLAKTSVTSVRAAVMKGPGRVEVEEFPRPEVEPGAVLMQVLFSGICGTDKHTFRGETIQYAGTPHERRLEYPLICGHENVGVVVDTGGDVLATDGKPLRPGDRIVPGANIACGECWFCREGFPYYACERLEDYGNSLNAKRPPHLFGGWAELMYLLPGTPIFRVPDELPSEVAVLTEVMAVTHGLDDAARLPTPHTFRPGSSVAVIGVGPLGLCHLIKARFLDCGELIAVDLLPSRLRVAEDFGATLTIDASALGREDRVEAVRQQTDGRGADVV